MTNLLELRLTPAILAEMHETILDALKSNSNDPANTTYCKIHDALRLSESTKRGIVVQVDASDVSELKSRAEFNVGSNGVCQENLAWSTDPADKGYWLGRMRAYKALLVQIEALGTISSQ